ncbi:glutathione S-transferase family protein [Caulobacter sp. UNC279MFTsu5.1]|uniref:glutathione S-transferase family protein n=1 Tax=Caulobacter sp. UNC279MFTsu5.1 TaxID=1502775 RepID=UPI0008E7278D|nr:glutathione S-transferase family protein [Caulobacter sp. UNC279MFTsu5.1]SFJ57387.1 glutathione S-transferase [Caulobacter sp. UNC279MFTsu5.1]
MYQLYYSPSTAALAAHWMLIEIGAPFELVLTDLATGAHKRPDYLKLNPGGVVPTLIVDGAPVLESTAILMLLAERHPDKGLAPAVGTPERAAYFQWMVYLANALLPGFRAWYYPHEPAGEANAEAAQAAARARIEAVWDRVDAQLAAKGPYMLGERLSAVDFLATMLMRWSRNTPRPATAWPHIARYLARMRAMPSLREVHAREGLTDWIDG